LQGFSFAGKQLNFDDHRSALFFEYVRLWHEILAINPEAKFLLENVMMKKEYIKVISDYMGVFPVRINSNLVSAQNRDRLYWTNIKTKKVGLFDEIWSDIPQPKDKEIYLKDILQPENEIDEKYYLKTHEILRGIEKAKGKTWHSGNKMGNMDFPNNINKKAKTLTVVQTNGGRETNHVIKLNKKLIPKDNQDKAGCLTGGGNHLDMDIICISMIDRKVDENRIIKDDYKLRRLTPIECERLQTVPDNYTACVSNTQRYKMLGNGWTVDVIVNNLNQLK